MPVTKTAKRALRASKRKFIVNKKLLANLEMAIRKARKGKSVSSIAKAFSLADRAAKKNIIHKNKAGNIKASLSALLPTKKGKIK
ncbi:30S ribosomal protein S20 [Patescibacteria group bacterium]|nr:30S ribosomal protein S20 [Patescibacteria group bacterium]